MLRLMGLFAVIPATILLTISFFVLVVLRKIESGSLKAFGVLVTALLWIAALFIISTGAYTLVTGRPVCPMMKMMQGKMHGQKQMMMQGKMPAMMPAQTDNSQMGN